MEILTDNSENQTSIFPNFSTVTETGSYKDTVNLPKTNFDMRANAIKREPEIQKFWEENQIYDRLSQNNPGELFILHDGPPYANGSLAYWSCFK